MLSCGTRSAACHRFSPTASSHGKAVIPSAAPPSTATQGPNINVRVCDLRIESLHVPTGAQAPQTTASDAAEKGPSHANPTHVPFNIDGLYVVLRLGPQVARTGSLWYNGDCLVPDVTDTFHGEVGDNDSDAYGELLHDDAYTEAKQACLVWDELFRFSIDSGASGSGDVRAGNKTSDAAHVPALEVELWRSTPSSELCLGRCLYDVVAERLAYLMTQSPQQHTSLTQWPWGGVGHPNSSPSPLPSADPTTVVDHTVPLSMAHATAGNSPRLGPRSGPGGLQGLYGGSRAPPLKLGIRLRVQTHGIPLPMHAPATHGGAPLLSNVMDNSLFGPGTDATGILSAAPPHQASYGSLGFSSMHGTQPMASGYDSHAGFPHTLHQHHSASPNSPYGVPQHGVLDPLMSQLLTPMALRSSMMAAAQGGAEPLPYLPPLTIPSATVGLSEASGAGILSAESPPIMQNTGTLPYNSTGGGGILDSSS